MLRIDRQAGMGMGLSAGGPEFGGNDQTLAIVEKNPGARPSPARAGAGHPRPALPQGPRPAGLCRKHGL